MIFDIRCTGGYVMTAPTFVSNATRPGRGALWMLLLMAAFTVAWVTLNGLLAEFQLASRAVTRPVIHAAVLYGLWVGLARAGFDFGQRVRIWLTIAIPFTLWLAAVWILAIDGAFVARPGGGPPLIPIAIFLPVLVFLPILFRSGRIGEILDATPPSWLVGLQLYRVFGAIFLVAWAHGRLAGIFALPAGIGDVMTGLLALPAAYYLAAGGRGGREAAVAWNVLGLIDFAVAVGIGILSSPAVQLITPDRPSIGAGTYPLVLIPTFAVPSSIILHALSLRQLTRIGRKAAPDRSARSPAAASAA
jgi:hypothetical protein